MSSKRVFDTFDRTETLLHISATAVPLPDQFGNRAARPQHFVVRVRSNNQPIHCLTSEIIERLTVFAGFTGKKTENYVYSDYIVKNLPVNFKRLRLITRTCGRQGTVRDH